MLNEESIASEFPEADAPAALDDAEPGPVREIELSLVEAADAAVPDTASLSERESPFDEVLAAAAPDDEADAAAALESPDSPPTTATVGSLGCETTFSTVVLTVVLGFG